MMDEPATLMLMRSRKVTTPRMTSIANMKFLGDPPPPSLFREGDSSVFILYSSI